MTTVVINGKNVELDADSHMADPSQWDEDIAKAFAQELGIWPLTDRHWTVINFMRNDFKAKGAAPTVRRIANNSGVPTKELYQLFPGGPGKNAAKIAGLAKPKGCV